MGISSDNIYPLQMLKKQDGSLIVLATTSTTNSAKMAIFKYNSNGTKDTGFNITPSSSFTLFGASSGGGYITFYPAVNGYTTRGHRIALQNDSKILVGADDGANIYIIRFDAETGTLDTSFGVSGVATITNAMLTLSSGESIVGLADIGTATITSSGAKKVIIAAKARVNSGGTLSYRPRIIAIGENGSTSGLILGANLAGGISGLNPEVKVMKIDDSSGTSRIVVAGNLNTSDVFAARFTLGTAISYDPTFGTPVGGGNPNRVGWIGANIANIGGSNSSDKTVDMAIGNSGEVYVSGSINEANINPGLFVAKFSSVGSLDNNFGLDGIIITGDGIPVFMPGNYETGTSVDLFQDGLVIAGYSKNGSAHYLVTARFNLNGVLDTSFGNQGFIVQELVNGSSYSETGTGVIADKATDKTTVLGKTFSGTNNSHMFIVRYKP